MDGMRFVVTWHFHGTLSANAVIRYKLPCNATLVQVDTNGTANVTRALIVGTAADDDGYIKPSPPAPTPPPSPKTAATSTAPSTPTPPNARTSPKTPCCC